MKGLEDQPIFCVSPCCGGFFCIVEKWFDKKEIVDDGSRECILTIWSSKVDVFVQP